VLSPAEVREDNALPSPHATVPPAPSKKHTPREIFRAANFFVAADPTHVSHSIRNLQQTDSFITATCRSLPSLVEQLGHDHIDLLKLAVEAAEYDVLEPVLTQELTVQILCVDSHNVDSLDAMTGTGRRLTTLGYAPV
jgi:hypothetical protein